MLDEMDPSIGGSLRTGRAKNASFCSYVRKISMQGRVCLLNSNVIDIFKRNFLTMDIDIILGACPLSFRVSRLPLDVDRRFKRLPSHLSTICFLMSSNTHQPWHY